MKKLLFLFCLLLPGIAFAQNGVMKYDNKVVINESSSDALQVSGGVKVDGSIEVYSIKLYGPLQRSGSNFLIPTNNGSNGQVLTTDGSGNTSWESPSGGGGGGIQVAILRETKTDGNNNGANTANTWLQRNVNSETDPDGIVTISSGDFVLGPGTYLIEAKVPCVGTQKSRAALYNVSNSTYVEYSQNNLNYGTSHITFAHISHVITLTESTTFDLRFRAAYTEPYNWELGAEDGIAGTPEYYSIVKIMKLN